MSNISHSGYLELLTDIKQKIRAAQYKALKKEFLQPMIGEIGWTHHTVIISKYKDDQERQFYIMTKANLNIDKFALGK